MVKIGGATLGSHDPTIEDIVYLQKQGTPLVIVHGGANIVTGWLKRLGISTSFFEGERVTDRATLDVVISVLAGLVNKEIVADIIAAGGQAVGISGADGALIQGRIKDKERGYMGAVVKVDTAPLLALLQSGFVPVVAPVSLHSFDRPDNSPTLLNINGDPVAGEIAAAIGADKLVFLTDVAGIFDQSGKLLSHLSPDEAEALLDSGVASGGMIPKIKACLKALSGGCTACIIDGKQPHALLKEVEESGRGTTIGRRK